MENDSSISKINGISLIALAQLGDRKQRIDPSLQSGSYYYNYKGTFSAYIAVMDANLRFMLISGLIVISDSGI